jgi:hypothetical protein
MVNETIKCPQCGYEIEISEVLTSQIRDNIKKEFEQNLKNKDVALINLKRELAQQKKLFLDERESIKSQINAKIEEERRNIQEKTKNEARNEFKVELTDLKNQISEKEKKISDYRTMELELRKQRRELESAKEDFEIKLTRKIDEEREKIKEQTAKKFTEEHHLKNIEKEKIILDLRKALEDAKRKAEQGSVQTQGEVFELNLEKILENSFPLDQIEPVPKGIRGADVIQKIYDSNQQQLCGIILWETKSTKNWSNAWVEKLKDDQRELGADIAVLVTETMPKEIENFGFLNGIWVTSNRLTIGLATVFRHNLVESSFTKLSSVGKNEKMETIYNYLSGSEFKQKVEAIVETFSSMQDQLNREKRAMTKIWKEREKQIERITNNTIGMYGELRGIIGATLPEIKALELDSSEEIKTLREGKL